MKLTINQLAKSSGISLDTLRYYRELGILRPIQDDINNYYYYDELDALDAIMAKRYRSIGMQVKTVKSSMNHSTANDQSIWISNRIDELNNQIKLLNNEINHMKEIEYYLNLGIQKEGQVEVLNWNHDVYSLYLFNKNELINNDNLITSWANAMPYTYPTIKISKEELSDELRTENYNVSVGLSCIDENINRYDLKIENPVIKVSASLCVRMFLKVKNPFNINPKDIAPLREYIKKHNYQYSCDSSGWILSMNSNGDKDYLMLIRVVIN